MIVYIDIVFLENLFMNYIILFATSQVLKVKKNHIRIIISSCLGSIYSILLYMQITKVYSNVFMKILLSILMVYIAYNANNIKTLLKQTLIFYLTTFIFGGCAFSLLYFVKPQEIFIKNGMYVGIYPIKIILLGSIVSLLITIIAFKLVKTKLKKKDMFCNLKIYIENKSIDTIAFIDTGNMLKDPISKMPVIVVEKNILEGIVPNEILENLEKILGGDIDEEVHSKIDKEYISKFRVIPFSSLGKENGLLLGIKATKIIIEFDGNETEYENIVIGIYDKELSKRKNYFALLGLDLLEGSYKKEYEYIENVKK